MSTPRSLRSMNSKRNLPSDSNPTHGDANSETLASTTHPSVPDSSLAHSLSGLAAKTSSSLLLYDEPAIPPSKHTRSSTVPSFDLDALRRRIETQVAVGMTSPVKTKLKALDYWTPYYLANIKHHQTHVFENAEHWFLTKAGVDPETIREFNDFIKRAGDELDMHLNTIYPKFDRSGEIFIGSKGRKDILKVELWHSSEDRRVMAHRCRDDFLDKLVKQRKRLIKQHKRSILEPLEAEAETKKTLRG